MPLDAFRIFYNHTIHPELMRQERRRKRLLRLFFFSLVFLAGLSTVSAFINIPALTLLLLMAVGAYLTYLVSQARQFQEEFKPKVVRLVLDFIDNSVNFGDLHYEEKKGVSRERFLESRIFMSPAQVFNSEDYIYGKVGELDFEMSELIVREISEVRNRLNYVFRGVFLHAVFHREIPGEILILPKNYRQYLTRSIREFTATGGRNVDALLQSETFKSYFMAWATPQAPVYHLLSLPMQELLVQYRERLGRELYVSFIGRDICIAVTQHKDMLEPYFFKANVSFDLVREFYEDIIILTSIVSDFDENT